MKTFLSNVHTKDVAFRRTERWRSPQLSHMSDT